MKTKINLHVPGYVAHKRNLGATLLLTLLMATALVTFLFLRSTAMWAQNSGAIIQGQLVNGSGASVANAMVQWSAVGVAGGATGNSDSQGQFAFEIPIARGGAQVQISVTANSYVPAQTSVQAQAGQTTPVQIVLAPKPRTQFAVVSGTLKDTKSHKAIPAAKISILGAGAALSATTNAYGAFKIKGVGFNSNLTLQAETLEVPCIPTSDFPLSVSVSPVTVKLTAQTLYIHTPHCPNNEGIAHRSEAPIQSPQLPIDDTLQWKQADSLSIQTNATTNAWNAGRVTDILRGPAGTGLVVASDEGGVWLIAENPAKSAIPASDTWPSITMSSLAYGPDGSGHVYGGTYDASPSSQGGVLWETDTSAGFPLLNWLPVNPQPSPCKSIEKILVIPEVRRIVLACDQGLFWSPIPPMPSVHGVYNWQLAQPTLLAQHVFSSLAKGTGWVVGSGKEGSVAAAWWGGTAPYHIIYTAAWKYGNLVLKPATVASPLSPILGRTSITSCPNNPNFMYAVAADQKDIGMSALWQSTTGGTSWNLVNLPSNPGNQGNFNNVIGVSGDCSIVAVGWESGTYLSFDSGTSWNQFTDGIDYNNIHSDIHALTFDPADPTVLFIGSDGGVVSASGLAPNVQPALESDWSRELVNLEFNPGAGSTSFGGLVAGAAQDNGVLYDDLPGGAWQHVTACHCDGGQALFATPPAIPPSDDLLIEREWGAPNWPLSSNEAVSGFIPFATEQTIPVRPPIVASVNDGIAQAVRTPGGFVNGSGEPMIAVDGDGTSLFGLFSMPDGSDLNWEPIGQIGGSESITAVGPTFNGSSVFVGTNAGNIYRFDAPYTGTALQLPLNSPELGGATVSGLFAFFSTVAWASYNVNSNDGYVMFWGGLTWDASGYGVLPNNLPFNSISARDLNTIFVSSSAAVYDTRDAGGSWSLANVGLPVNITHNPNLYYLVSSPTSPAALYLSTWGRSLWVTPVP
jgi:hypothetical protein